MGGQRIVFDNWSLGGNGLELGGWIFALYLYVTLLSEDSMLWLSCTVNIRLLASFFSSLLCLGGLTIIIIILSYLTYHYLSFHLYRTKHIHLYPYPRPI